MHNWDHKRAFQVGHGVLCTHPESDITRVHSCEVWESRGVFFLGFFRFLFSFWCLFVCGGFLFGSLIWSFFYFKPEDDLGLVLGLFCLHKYQ